MSFNLGSERSPKRRNQRHGLTPMSFNLGSERAKVNELEQPSLTPISIQLGLESIFNCDISFLGTLLTCNAVN